MKNRFLFVALIPLLLTSCGKTPHEDTYVTKTINVNYVTKTNDTTCDIRYYNGSTIPYVSIKDYQKLLYRGRKYDEGRDKFDILKRGDFYTITVAGDYKASFDISKNKMMSSNLWSFKNTNLNGYGNVSSVCYDGLPFTKVKSVRFEGEIKETVIDFSKYHMKIYGDKESVYVPLNFATDLFSNENILQGAYNGKDLFVFNVTENEELESFGSTYYDSMYLTPMSKEYSEFVYNELCLNQDLFLGRPGRSSLETYYDLSKGLDTALNSRELGRTIANYMKSGDLTKFLAGATLFGYLHQDGGHSSYSPLDVRYVDEETLQYKKPIWLTDKLEKDVKDLVNAELNKKYDELVHYDVPFRERSAIRADRSRALSKPYSSELRGYDTYTKDGDIAYIHIDGFMGEIALQNEWNKYYKGERDTIPFGNKTGGAVGAISYGVKEASKDSSIKHIVVDLSSNSGGSTDEMLFMIALLTGSKEFYTYNSMSQSYNIGVYDFDFNFDRKFDEKDDEMLNLLKGKDITVLTTKNGFSCGGISPIYLHDEGLFTIGEECGGGSCSIYMQYDGFGNFLRSSSPSQTVTKNKINIDVARKNVCDSKIDFPTVGNVRNYSELFNTSKLRTLIENHYKK